MKPSTLLATFFLFSSAAFAQGTPDSLNLEAAVGQALSNSPSIQEKEAALERSDWRKFQTLGAGFLPKVKVGYTRFVANEYQLSNVNFGGETLGFPGAYSNSVLEAQASVPIFDGLANIYHYQAAELEHSAAQEELTRSKFELTQQVRLAFYQAIAAVELQDVATQNVKTLEDHLKQVEARRHGGAATSYDTLRVSVQLSEGRTDAIDADDNVAIARQKLTTLLGLDTDERALVGTLPTPDASRAKTITLNGTPVDRTDIEALNMRTSAADKMRAAQYAWFIPSVSLLGTYDYYNVMNESTTDGSVSGSGNYKNAYSVAFAFSWNLFDGGVAFSQTKQASYARIEAEKRAEAARLQVPSDFLMWKKRFLANTDRYQARQQDVSRSVESVRLAKEEEKAGARTSTETLDAELDLFRSRAGVVNSQVNALEAQIRLELALGRTL